MGSEREPKNSMGSQAFGAFPFGSAAAAGTPDQVLWRSTARFEIELPVGMVGI